MFNNWFRQPRKPIKKRSEDGLDNKTGKERGDFDTDYDSTWEDDNDITESEGNSLQWGRWAEKNEYAAKDMQNFRHMLRKADEKTTVNIQLRQKDLPNLLFYQNKKRSKPDGMFIEEFHNEWFRDYRTLEHTQSYIQWLFPIQEKGMNLDSYILTEEEIKLFREDVEVKKRLVKSYKLMLDFYGIRLLDEKTGKVCRTKLKWKERFDNLNRNTHNNLRITRILKCLGIMGFQHYQAPLVKFFLYQTLVKKRLPRVKQSALDYFLFSVVDKKQRRKLIKYAFQNFQPREDFVWCPKRIQRRFLKEINQQETEDNYSDLSEPESDAEAEENFPENKENEEASFSNSVQGAVQGDPSDGEVGEGNLTVTKASLSRNSPRDLDTHPSQQNMRRMDDGALKTNVMSSTENDTAGAGAVMHSGKETAPLSDNTMSTEEPDVTDSSPQNDYVSRQRSEEDSSGTNTPNQSDSAMSASSITSEDHRVHKHTAKDDTRTTTDDALKQVIPSRPDNEDNTDDLEGFKNTTSAEIESVEMSEDQRVQENKAREGNGRTGNDAQEPGISTKNKNNVNNAIECSGGDTEMSHVGDTEMSENQESDQRRVKEPPNKDDDDEMEFSEPKGGTDTTQNILPNVDDETHSEEMPELQSGTDTTHLSDSKVPGESSTVESDEMSDSQESDQRVDQEPPNKDDAEKMELSEKECDIETAQNILTNVDDETHSGEMPELQNDTDTTHLDDSKMPGQSSTVESDEMSDKLENDQRLDKEPPNRDDDADETV